MDLNSTVIAGEKRASKSESPWRKKVTIWNLRSWWCHAFWIFRVPPVDLRCDWAILSCGGSFHVVLSFQVSPSEGLRVVVSREWVLFFLLSLALPSVVPDRGVTNIGSYVPKVLESANLPRPESRSVRASRCHVGGQSTPSSGATGDVNTLTRKSRSIEEQDVLRGAVKCNEVKWSSVAREGRAQGSLKTEVSGDGIQKHYVLFIKWDPDIAL